MRSDILPRGISPDYQLPDHTSTVRKLSEHRGDHPCCPMDTALYAYCGLGRRHREQMQGLILAQHEHQCSPRLLQRHRNGTVGESLTQLTHPGFHRFRSVHQLSAFPLLRARGLQAPHVLFIRPIDTHERRELRLLLQRFDF